MNMMNWSQGGLIWSRLMDAQEGAISRETAEFLLAINFGETDRERMLELADRSEAGAFTNEEQAEFDGYLHVGNLLAAIRSKARLALKAKPHDPSAFVNRDLI